MSAAHPEALCLCTPRWPDAERQQRATITVKVGGDARADAGNLSSAKLKRDPPCRSRPGEYPLRSIVVTPAPDRLSAITETLSRLCLKPAGTSPIPLACVRPPFPVRLARAEGCAEVCGFWHGHPPILQRHPFIWPAHIEKEKTRSRPCWKRPAPPPTTRKGRESSVGPWSEPGRCTFQRSRLVARSARWYGRLPELPRQHFGVPPASAQHGCNSPRLPAILFIPSVADGTGQGTGSNQVPPAL